MDLSRAFNQSAASCSRSLLTLPITSVEECFDPGSEIESRTQARVPGRVVSFSAVRYGLARRLPRGGHDLTSASWSTFTDLIPFHALFETIQLSCLLLVTFSSHG